MGEHHAANLLVVAEVALSLDLLAVDVDHGRGDFLDLQPQDLGILEVLRDAAIVELDLRSLDLVLDAQQVRQHLLAVRAPGAEEDQHPHRPRLLLERRHRALVVDGAQVGHVIAAEDRVEVLVDAGTGPVTINGSSVPDLANLWLSKPSAYAGSYVAAHRTDFQPRLRKLCTLPVTSCH